VGSWAGSEHKVGVASGLSRVESRDPVSVREVALCVVDEQELGPVAAGAVVGVVGAPGAVVVAAEVLDGVSIALGTVVISVEDVMAWRGTAGIVVSNAGELEVGVIANGVVSGAALVVVVVEAVVRSVAGATGWYAVMGRRNAEACELPGESTLTSASWAAADGGSRRQRSLTVSGMLVSAAAGYARPAKRGGGTRRQDH
jgi:hypothetical protein